MREQDENSKKHETPHWREVVDTGTCLPTCNGVHNAREEKRQQNDDRPSGHSVSAHIEQSLRNNDSMYGESFAHRLVPEVAVPSSQRVRLRDVSE